jgi:hypothetical protein
MKKWFSRNILYLIGAVAGAVAGWLYWKLVGCSSGTCAITSKPLNSSLYGALMGALLFGLFQKDKPKQSLSQEKNNQNDL